MKNKLLSKVKQNKFMRRLALFYIFANLFNAWQKRAQLGFYLYLYLYLYSQS